MENKTDLQTLAVSFKEKFIEHWTSFEKHECWRDIFTVYPSRHAEETDEDGEEITRYVHKTHGLGFSLSQEEAQEGWTRQMETNCNFLFPPMLGLLEKEAAAVFDEILTSPKFEKNRQHAVLSLNAFKNALDSLTKAKDASGRIVDLKPKMLIVPAALQFEVDRQIPREYLEGLGVTLIINLALNNPSAWFLITDAPDGFKCFERQKPELDVWAEEGGRHFTTEKIVDVEPKLLFKISARYSFGCTNPNAVFASTGTGVSK